MAIKHCSPAEGIAPNAGARPPGPLGASRAGSCDTGTSKARPSAVPLNWLWQPYRDDGSMDTRTATGIPWLMVPYSLAADVTLRRSARYTVRAADPGTVTVQPLGRRSYRIFGDKPGRTHLAAVDAAGVPQAFLEVSVKTAWWRKLAFYFVSDSDDKTGKTIHHATRRNGGELAAMVDKMNAILRPQANVQFKVVENRRYQDVKLLGNFGHPGERHHSPLLSDLMYPRSGAFEFEAGARIGRACSDLINPWDGVAAAGP